MTMRNAIRFSVGLSLSAATLLLAGSPTVGAGDWGFRFSGDLGAASQSSAKNFFDSPDQNFKYSSRGIELGVAYKDWDVSSFLYTIKVSEGHLNRGFAQKNSGPWGASGETIFLAPGVTLPEGAYLDPNGVRLIGLKAGRFVTLWRPSKLLRIGVPIHVGAAAYSGQATLTNYVVSLQPAQGGFGLVSQPVVTKVPGAQIFSGKMNPYPIVDVGIGLKFRSAKWAEIELFLKADNPRFPIFAWGMTFRRSRD
jgi:hypothetical protein